MAEGLNFICENLDGEECQLLEMVRAILEDGKYPFSLECPYAPEDRIDCIYFDGTSEAFATKEAK